LYGEKITSIINNWAEIFVLNGGSMPKPVFVSPTPFHKSGDEGETEAPPIDVTTLDGLTDFLFSRVGLTIITYN